MTNPNEMLKIHQDPLGLRALPLHASPEDGWPVIRQALETHRSRQHTRRTAAGWFAVAATVLLAVFVVFQPQPGVQVSDPVATTGAQPASLTEEEKSLESLIGLSQTLESQLRGVREESSSMPANSAIYVAELEDLIAQVDRELNYAPDSMNLWGQRVNLLLDLAQIYQHQWETDYGRMASL